MEKGKQMRFTDVELKMIKDMFQGDEARLKLMRKVFLPELDPEAPLGQMIDLYLTLNVKEMTPEGAMVAIQSRNDLIAHVDQQLLQMRVLADMTEETPSERKVRLAKDSSK